MTGGRLARLRKAGLQPLRRLWERQRFLGRRIDYYDYLSDLLAGMEGARTLKDVFLSDARRYGAASLRGRLSARWLDMYQRAGGDLYATWKAHFPRTELVLIRAAQSQGNQALVQTLAELSGVLRLLQQTRHLLTATLWPALLALCVVILVTLMVPWFTVPRLTAAFSTVPVEYYGALARRLVNFSATVDRFWLIMVFVPLAGIWFVVTGLPRRAGPLRRYLDQWLWWRVYRHVSALHFLAFLRIALGDHLTGTIRLRNALLQVQAGAQPWLAAHVDIMLRRLERGHSGAHAFDTGLFTREQFWFLDDMVMSRGLGAGLMLSQDRLRRQILGAVARQAVVMRWTMLLACVAYVLGLVLWHYAVIDELRRTLTFYLAQ